MIREGEDGEVVVREFADWKPNPEQQFAPGGTGADSPGRGQRILARISHPLFYLRGRGRIIYGKKLLKCWT